MTLSRRQMIKLGAGAAGTWIAGATRWPRTAAAAGHKIPIALELWSVRQQCEEDLPGVLRAVADMGYEAVEFAHSYYGHDAATLKRLLDQNGLKSCGMHLSLRMIEGDAFDETVRIHKLLKTPYLILAAVPKKSLASVQATLDTAKLIDELSEKLKPHGMKIGYHCHAGDFVNLDGQTPWEILAANTNPDVVMQLDVGNCIAGGGDPIAMLKKFPGRTLSIHLKEHGGEPGAVLGEGEVHWNEVFQVCETTGGTQWYVVEEEGRKGPAALEAVGRAIRNLRKMGK